jgi:uncharacterized protein YndB with AHSA1/START domain
VLVITRVFDAPRSLVFKVWTQPEHLVRWWGPRGFTTPSCKMDVRARVVPSASACARPKAPTIGCRACIAKSSSRSGSSAQDAEGKLGHETLLTVNFAEHGAKTKLTLHQAIFESVTARDDHRSGWTECLDRLEDYLANA